jgi:hypothetical protein
MFTGRIRRGGLNMERELLKFIDKDGIERVLEIHFEMGNRTNCSDCPLSKLYPYIGPVTGTSTCSILAQGPCNAYFIGNRSFIDSYGSFFCSRNKIINAVEISSRDRVEFEVGEEFKRQRKVSLGDLIDKVCPGRCVLLENTARCTEEYRKCPGCLLGDLEED